MHKETIDAVPNAIPGRTDIELEIYGMEGIPEKDMDERRRLLEQKTQGNAMLFKNTASVVKVLLLLSSINVIGVRLRILILNFLMSYV